MKPKPVTHDQLTRYAESWLRMHKCKVVAREYHTILSEIPDAIGFTSYLSILIECKASRADFLHDRRKPTRRNPKRALGQQRYYLAPEGLIAKEELPEGWGLIELKRRKEKTHYGAKGSLYTMMKVRATNRPLDTATLTQERRFLVTLASKTLLALHFLKPLTTCHINYDARRVRKVITNG